MGRRNREETCLSLVCEISVAVVYNRTYVEFCRWAQLFTLRDTAAVFV
jgi:hypothetical protein